MIKKKLGEILVTSGAVSGADVESALHDQTAGEPSRLGDLLVANGKLDSEQLGRALATQYGLPYVDLPVLSQATLDLVPIDLQRQFRFVPLGVEGTELSIAMADLSNIEVLAVLEQQWTKVHVHVSSGEEIDALHATVSGIFAVPTDGLTHVAPTMSEFSPSTEDLFGMMELEALSVPTDGTAPVPVIAPVQVAESRISGVSTPPRAEDLFGDLNLESSRTGISAKPPPEFLPESGTEGTEADPVSDVDVDLAEAIPTTVAPLEPADSVDAIEVLEDVGPSGGHTMPAVSESFQISSGSLSVARLAESPESDAVVEVTQMAPGTPEEVFDPPSENSERLGSPLIEASVEPVAGWSGSLDHLMPSKLVIGVTRALLARGLVTEAEILAALGQK